ncbi:MAG TPA: M48 family metalloprotease, partial [Planctomycetota bacterium]|nr:M48 family metalloprotease [Planctomycetota bacterium]
MSMDFFGHQERARRATRSLIVYFVLAVASIVLLVYLAATALLLASDLQPTWWRPQVLLIVGAGTIAIVALAALFKTAQLRSGGAAVAQMLGGRPVAPDTQDLAERTLLNVVEEMAIAAGVVVPSVFVLDDEHGINAFAAGWGTGDAAVAVTRGALEQLDRDELQGVIGHEFSHLFHGDMRLNVRLMGVLFGILCLATIGQIILRSIGRGSGGGGGKKGGAIAALAMFALALMAIGYLGVFFGRLIKAAVSRQREFLADASSVQYTRNPAGIGMALAKIGGKVGSRIHANHKEEVTHMLFADGVQHMFARLHATHPPVEVRIEQVLPGFLQQLQRGQPPIAAVTAVAPPLPEGVVAGVAGGTARPRGGAEALVASVGAPQAEHLQRARDLLAALPFELVAATRERSGARALCCALLLERDGPL